MRLIDPFPGCYDAADPFGNSRPPRTYAHTGADWMVRASAQAPALGAGVVVNRQWHAGNGNTVTIKLDGSDLYYAYLHLAEPAAVAPGARVELGQTVGKVGATGTNARGPHLHVTVSDAPTAYVGLGNRRDPWALIQSHLATQTKEDDMPYSIVSDAQTDAQFVCSLISGRRFRVATPYHVTLLRRYKINDGGDKMLVAELDIVASYLQIINAPATAGGGGLSDADAARLVKLINDDAARRMAS